MEGQWKVMEGQWKVSGRLVEGHGRPWPIWAALVTL